MPRTKKRVATAALTAGLNLKRKGMPLASSIVGVSVLGPAAAAGPVFRVLTTTELDPKDDKALAVTAMAPAAVVGDKFMGTARKAAKLSISKAATETFQNLKSLLDTLPSHATMKKRKPKITTAATSKRVAEEDRNVKLKAFIYAASRENDNDYHLIIGLSPTAATEVYMTMELSGLPPSSSKSFSKLKKARKSYHDFFAPNPPGFTYDFYDPPVPIEVAGSLFWDASHATGSRPGPQSLRSRVPVVWEVHPISSIEFNP